MKQNYVFASIISGFMKFLSAVTLVGGAALFFSLGGLVTPPTVGIYFILLLILAGICAGIGVGVELLIDAQLSREQLAELAAQQFDVTEQQIKLLKIIAKSIHEK